MRRVFVLSSLALVVGLLAYRSVPADDGAKHKYMGVNTCKMCHQKPEEGQQYKIWSEGPHAKAFEDLGSDKAKEAAAKKGVKGNPQEAPECLKCHLTGYGEPQEAFDKPDKWAKDGEFSKLGVQCESCHGPGSDYWKKETMKDKDKAVAAGCVIPDEKTCRKCHNEESPFYKEFKFDEFKAKIAHPVPKK